eukprot:gene7128-14501_t
MAIDISIRLSHDVSEITPNIVSEIPLMRRCSLLGGYSSIIVHIILAFFCILTLVYKRQHEKPKRNWLIWSLDVMKQGVGASYGHFVNIFVSAIIAQRIVGGDECQWYCLNFVVDSTFGTIFNIALLSLVEFISTRSPRNIMQSGHYGSPVSLWIWLAQLFVWLSIITLGKLTILPIIVYLADFLNIWIGFVFRGLADYPDLELVMVVVVIPVILNSVQFWLQDNYLKHKDNHHKSSLSSSSLSSSSLSNEHHHHRNQSQSEQECIHLKSTAVDPSSNTSSVAFKSPPKSSSKFTTATATAPSSSVSSSSTASVNDSRSTHIHTHTPYDCITYAEDSLDPQFGDEYLEFLEGQRFSLERKEGGDVLIPIHGGGGAAGGSVSSIASNLLTRAQDMFSGLTDLYRPLTYEDHSDTLPVLPKQGVCSRGNGSGSGDSLRNDR